MDELIKWYLDFQPFSEEENELLGIGRTGEPEIVSDEQYLALCQEYFNRMPFANVSIHDRNLVFDDSGTALIEQVFEREVDDDTLVISTQYEHGSVRKCLENCKNVLFVQSEQDIRSYKTKEIVQKTKGYKKVFVYIIGTQLSTGEITPQNFYVELKKELEEHNVNFKIMIDDVHGMFLLPRDYSIYDYVLYTAHSLVPEYDMGMMITKEDGYGIKAYNWAKEYLRRLDIILQNRYKMSLFKNIMIQYFSKLVADTSVFRLYSQTVDHIFSIETKGMKYTQAEWDKLDSYKIRVSEHDNYMGFIRIRYQEFVRHPKEKALEGLKLLLKIINKNLAINRMRE